MVSIHLFAVAALFASALAGRVGEDGTGAMWIAPELVQAADPLASHCSLPANARAVELRFELLDPGDIALHSRKVSTDSLEIVDFDWNPATSELTYRASAGSQVFADLALPVTETTAANCGSR